MITRIKRKVATVMLRNSPEIVLLLSVTSVLMGVGFFLGSTNNNYYALTDLMPFLGWGLLFLLHGSIKLVSLLIYTVPTKLDIVNSSLGIWAWNYIFLSFTLFDNVPIAPTELLLFVPVLAEVLALTSIIYNKNCVKG